VTDLRATLERTLGDTYTLEREIAAGNMSRVFVALDRALGREIIIEPPTIISRMDAWSEWSAVREVVPSSMRCWK